MTDVTAAPDLNLDITAVLARLSERLGQSAQTIEIQQLQIEKLSGMLAKRDALIAELTPKEPSNGKVKASPLPGRAKAIKAERARRNLGIPSSIYSRR